MFVWRKIARSRRTRSLAVVTLLLVQKRKRRRSGVRLEERDEVLEAYPLRFRESNRVPLSKGDKNQYGARIAGPEISAGAWDGLSAGLMSPQIVNRLVDSRHFVGATLRLAGRRLCHGSLISGNVSFSRFSRLLDPACLRDPESGTFQKKAATSRLAFLPLLRQCRSSVES